jgi:hypothetical protein
MRRSNLNPPRAAKKEQEESSVFYEKFSKIERYPPPQLLFQFFDPFLCLVLCRLLISLDKALIASLNNPTEKNVGVLLKSSSLCRYLGGSIGILCKSGTNNSSASSLDFF